VEDGEQRPGLLAPGVQHRADGGLGRAGNGGHGCLAFW